MVVLERLALALVLGAGLCHMQKDDVQIEQRLVLYRGQYLIARNSIRYYSQANGGALAMV